MIRFDGLRNALSKIGSRDARTENTTQAGRRIYGQGELDRWEQDELLRRVCREVVRDANSAVTVTGDEVDPRDITRALDRLGAPGALGRAGYLARMYGGAAVWMVTDRGDGDALEEPLAPGEQLQRLVVMDRWELSATDAIETDPTSEAYLQPQTYSYTPAAAAGTVRRIHHTRLIRILGQDVPDRLASHYRYWGAPVIESTADELTHLRMAAQGGAELTHTFGTLIFRLANLAELLEAKDGKSKLEAWFDVQMQAFSTLRGWLLGEGQEVAFNSPTLSGWTDIYDRLAQLYAAVNEYPVTKLYGQAPGGLSTDDASGRANWNATVDNYRDDRLRPAYRQLLEALFADPSGPTGGEMPAHYEIAFAPVESPQPGEQAEITKTRGEALATAYDRGAIDLEEYRANLAELDGWVLQEADDDDELDDLEDGDPLELDLALASAGEEE